MTTNGPYGGDIRALAISPNFTSDQTIFAGTGTWGGSVYSYTFAADTNPPTTTLETTPLTPDGNNGWFKTTPSITLTSNEPGTTYYQWDSTSTSGWTTYSNSFNGIEGTHTLYYYSVDTAGNTETVKSQLFKVDTIPPLPPTLSAALETSTSIRLDWNGASDVGSGNLAYEVYNGATRISGSSSSPHVLSGLSPGTTYNLTVRSMDEAGNLSAPSNTVSVTTPAGADNTPLSAPTIVGFSPSNTEINLYWRAASDNVGVAGYKIYNANTNSQVATATNTYYLFSGLTPNTLYSYYVKAYDTSNNLSTASNIIAITVGGSGATNSGSGVVPVTVSLNSNVMLTFADVTASGTTTMTISPTLVSPAPSGFNFYGNQLDISTSATFTPPITIAIHYDPSTISINEADLKLFHWNGSSWEDVTLYVDTANNIIVGQVNSLSPFILGGPASSSIATSADTHSKIMVGFFALVLGTGLIVITSLKKLQAWMKSPWINENVN